MQSSRSLASFDFLIRGGFMIKILRRRKTGTFSGLCSHYPRPPYMLFTKILESDLLHIAK